MAESTEMGNQLRFSGTPNVSVTMRDLQAAVNFLTNSFNLLEQQLAEMKKGVAEVNNQITFKSQEIVDCEDDERPVRYHSQCPERLEDGSLIDFRNWRSMWENYSTAQGWNELPNRQQVVALMLSISNTIQQEMKWILKNENKDSMTPKAILDKLDDYFQSKKSIDVYRFEYFNCVQEEGESFHSFFTRLLDLSMCADLCKHCEDKVLTSLVIRGIRDANTRLELLRRVPAPSLYDVILFCEGREEIEKNRAAVAEK
jgi:hypothetical protein